MKSKLLFGALVGGIALASCTADEEFASVAEQTSPIKFAVSMETANGGLTKAEMTDKMKLNFVTGDLMSLYHGVSAPTTSFTGYQNAIYEGTAEEGEALVFTTKSMVLAGGAIMVYPCDTTFSINSGSATPKVQIPAEQNAKTKTLLPFASEVLTIGAYNGNSGAGTAGYGKYYPIVLKQIGSTLKLNTIASNTKTIEDLNLKTPLKVANIEITAEDASGNGVFNTTVELVAASTGTPASQSDYPIWTNVSDVDFTNAVAVKTLKTRDVVDNFTAIFSLLPAEETTALGSASIKINTNYGYVELVDATLNPEKVWNTVNGTEATAKTIKEGIEDVLKKTWIANTTSVNFKDEKTGGSFTRTIKADMGNLKMDKLHIEDEQNLLDALKVYDAIGGNAEVTFYLDGNDDNEFVMNEECFAEYKKRIESADNKITFTPCSESGEECDTVKLVVKEETEVPAVLKFGGATNVELVGDWTWTGSAAVQTENVSAIIVNESANLTLSGTVEYNKTGTVETVLMNNGNVEIDGAVVLKMGMTNNSKIVIPEDGEFLMSAGGTLTNETEGVIENNYSMGVQNGTGGVIKNYGTIKQMNEEAYTYVSENATGTLDAFKNVKSDTNKFGTIELFGTGNLNTTVGEETKQGFLKVTTNVAVVGATEIGEYANYVEITGACERLSGIPDNVKFVDVKSTKRVVWETEATGVTIQGLIVPQNTSVNIPRGSKVTATTSYVEGRIYVAGTFTCSDFDGYMGGADSDKNNVIVSK